VLNLMLLPFILLFLVIFFLLKHAEQLHSKTSMFGPREWTPLAKWKFREYNELHSFFQERLDASYAPAHNYILQFPSTLINIVAQFVAYVSGAVVGIIALITLLDASLAIEVHIWGNPLIWYLAVFSGILAIARSYIPPKRLVFKPVEIMREVISYTHYLPKLWRGRTHTYQVKEQFEQLYKRKTTVFLDEVICVCLTPLILIFYLPPKASRIVRFLREQTVHVKGVGDLCSYATFNLAANGDRLYEMDASAQANMYGTLSLHSNNEMQPTDFRRRSHQRGDVGATGSTGSVPGGVNKKNTASLLEEDGDSNGSHHPPTASFLATQEHEAPSFAYGDQGKLEKSLLSFCVNNPYFVPSEKTATAFLKNVTQTALEELQLKQYPEGLPGSPLGTLPLQRAYSDFDDTFLKAQPEVGGAAGMGNRPPTDHKTSVDEEEPLDGDLLALAMGSEAALPVESAHEAQTQRGDEKEHFPGLLGEMHPSSPPPSLRQRHTHTHTRARAHGDGDSDGVTENDHDSHVSGQGASFAGLSQSYMPNHPSLRQSMLQSTLLGPQQQALTGMCV
jgi:hypothetical protein